MIDAKQRQRRLTFDEITYILTDIEAVKSKYFEIITTSVFNQHKAGLIEQLEKIKIYPYMIDKLKEEITRQYYTSQVQAGECVGIIAAQSIGERQTQMTLNTFHFSGQAIQLVVTGVSRFTELLNASKTSKNSVTHIYYNNEPEPVYIRDIIGSSLLYMTFESFTDDINIYKSIEYDIPQWYGAFNDLYRVGLKNYNNVISCIISPSMTFSCRCSLEDISLALMKHYGDIRCVWSPSCYNQIDIWVSTDDVDDYNRMLFISDVVLVNLNDVHICGIASIERVQVTTTSVEVIGKNIKQIMTLPWVNTKKTHSNCMWETLETFGIEATRELLIREFTSIIATDAFINNRHIELLVDSMLYTGTITSVSRYGVQSNQKSILTRSSFEESLDQFLKAGAYGQVEDANAVSASVMCGKVARVGSGLCDILYNV